VTRDPRIDAYIAKAQARRQKRIAAAVEWPSQSERRHWK
jgi:hypothetical protein